MISRLKLLILINWQEQGGWSFLGVLNKRVKKTVILQPLSFRWGGNGIFTKISNYLAEFYVPLIAVFRKTQHDVIISWQMRIGICYGILNRVFHDRKPPLHIIQDFHVDLTQNRKFYQLQISLLKLAIPGIDYFCCTSSEEEAIYSRMFNISRQQIAFLPLMPPKHYFDEPDRPQQDCILSYGKSDRDFDTLVRAVTPLNIKTFIISNKYKPQVPIAENVCLVRKHISDEEMIQRIASSRIVVLPLKDYQISAGQLSMLEVMALGRPLIITMNMATKEYAVHKHSVLFFEAGDEKELAHHIQYLWNNREAAEHLGQRARQAALKLEGSRITVFGNLLERCSIDIQKGESQ